MYGWWSLRRGGRKGRFDFLHGSGVMLSYPLCISEGDTAGVGGVM